MEPVPNGFAYVNGRFTRLCPPGMTMNDLGVCIRPTMTRKSFASEASITKTTLIFGGKKEYGDAQAILGKYNASAHDISFTTSVPLDPAPVSQIKLVDGSQNVFFVAQSNNVQSSVKNDELQSLQFLDGTKTYPISYSLLDEEAEAPQDSVLKVEYANNDVNGRLYVLGSPQNKIFKALFTASNYKTGVKVGFGTALQFEKPGVSVEGSTDPYYVGSYSRLIFNPLNLDELIIQSVGIVQSGLDNAGSIEPITSGDYRTEYQTDECNSRVYDPFNPMDPFPQILKSTSDLSSRGFYKESLQDSYGYVVAGAQQTAAVENYNGQALAVRYLINDECRNLSPPRRPQVQAFTTIDLNLGPNTGDIRMARFDIENLKYASSLNLGNGSPDSIYVFGSDGLASDTNDTLISFISESITYDDSSGGIQFDLGVGTAAGPTRTTRTFALGTVSIPQSFIDLSNYLKSIIETAVPGTLVEYEDSYTTLGGIFQIKITNDNPVYVSLQCTASQSRFATAFGFFISTAYNVNTVASNPAYLTAQAPGSMPTGDSPTDYNGLSWDDTSPPSVGTRTNVKAMPVGIGGDMKGSGIIAWSFDPVSQALAFATGDPSQSQALGGFQRDQEIFADAGVYSYEVPANCVDLEIHVWGAGGSSDSYSKVGRGGAGAFVGGHIMREKWAPGDTLQIIVGGTTSNGSVGSGGLGSRSKQGAGGGRSSISKNGSDIVVVGGGGGSVGNALGGAATATETAAESGSPAENGGRGATTVSGGLGGAVFGEKRLKRATDGRLGQGGSSTWTINSSAAGGGGGGGGFYGGGAGGFLGYTGDNRDVAAGGGGGSSYTKNIRGLLAVSGSGAEAPYTSSPYYVAGVAAGGSPETGGIGGHGRVVIIATIGTLSATRNWTSGTGTPNQIWASYIGAFTELNDTEMGQIAPNGTITKNADWSSKFYQIDIDPSDAGYGDGTVRQIFMSPNGLLVVIMNNDQNLVYDADQDVSYVWWSFVPKPTTAPPLRLSLRNTNCDVFGNLDYTNADTTESILGPLTNVRSIRPVDPLSGPLGDIVFIGDGVRIVSPPINDQGQWTNSRFVIDADTLLPLDLSMSFVDAQYAKNDLQIVGKPKSLNLTTMFKTPWAPTFASFYAPSDVVDEAINSIGWPLNGPPDTTVPRISDAPGPLTSPGTLPLADWTTCNTELVPNTICFIKRTTDSVWTALNLYNPTTTNPITPASGSESSPPEIALQIDFPQLQSNLQTALTNYLTSISVIGASVNALIGPTNQLAITISDLTVDTTFTLAFTVIGLDITSFFGPPSSDLQTNIDDAIKECGATLGFQAFTYDSETTSTVISEQPVYQASWISPAPIKQSAILGGSSSKALTPVSVALPTNSADISNIYTSYAPNIKYATVDPGVISASGTVVAIGGFIASPSDSVRNQKSLEATEYYPSTQSIAQPVAFSGQSQHIDFVYDSGPTGSVGINYSSNLPRHLRLITPSDFAMEAGGPMLASGPTGSHAVAGYYWTLFDVGPTGPSKVDVISNVEIRSPANILVSDDLGSSFTYCESYLATHLTTKSETPVSMYAKTGLDAYHTFSSNGTVVGVGPAKIKQGESGKLNAMVSQFNDVKWFPNPDAAAPMKGCFVAVGQFVWEINAMLSPSVIWPTDFRSLKGVVWVSDNGHRWTTMPMFHERLDASGETFWLVYRMDYLDPIRLLATLNTDLGLYVFNVSQLMTAVENLFTDGPCLDFSGRFLNDRKCLLLTPAGTMGPYAATCKTKNGTGQCLSCLGDGMPVVIPQLIGQQGVIQPDVDVCLVRPHGDADPAKNPKSYTTIEAMLDAYALAAYAGYNDGTKNVYVNGLRQSFLQNTDTNDNSIFVCPQYTNVDNTPSTVLGRESALSSQLQCDLNPAFDTQVANSGLVNTTGPAIVRRPASLSSETPPTYIPDASYDGTAYQLNYATEWRHLTFVKYDTHGAQSGVPLLFSNECPSTLGIGGSKYTYPDLTIDSEVYPTRSERVIKVTNLAAFSDDNVTYLSGPFTQNQSLPDVWNFSDNNRAVLANSDTLDEFEYSQLTTTPLVYNPAGVTGGTGGAFQSKNPYLYKLQSIQYPYDGQDANQQTVGRDPQVYEPGYGPLTKYAAEGRIGFDVYGAPGASTAEPWPTNPLPEEGFGYWYMRPCNPDFPLDAASNLLITTKSPYEQARPSIIVASLGYGALSLSRAVGSYPTVNSASKPVPLFSYDPVKPLAYLTAGWTSFLPYSDTTNNRDKNYAMSTGDYFGPVGAFDVNKFNQSKYAIQNMLALRLKNEPKQMNLESDSSNWKVLVSNNFYRPRNWAFSGLLLKTDGTPYTEMIGNGVMQQCLSSDQPNSDGLYEFLIPDPYFAQEPVNSEIIGFSNTTHTMGPTGIVRGPDYERIKNVLGLSSYPASLHVLDCDASTIFPQILEKHVSFHYWKFDAITKESTLDIFVNMSKFFTFGLDFSWTTYVDQMPSSLKIQTSDLTKVFGVFATNAPTVSASAALIDFASNPAANFYWSDPAAQTTRSLQSFDGLKYEGLEALIVLPLSTLGARARGRGRVPLASQYLDDPPVSLLHARYKLTVKTEEPDLALLQNPNANVNGINLFGSDSQNGSTGFLPVPDPRGLSNASNWTPVLGSLVNVTASDYDIELNNAHKFAFVGGTSVRQDMLAQDDSELLKYGNIEYGFGLRIDKTAVVTADRRSELKSKADIPADHGYVSMVRTVIDGHERFTNPTVVDALPHVIRLTYITKYVPSRLQKYGAIIKLPAMRPIVDPILGPNLVQSLLNPLRPNGIVSVEKVPLVAWNRVTRSPASTGSKLLDYGNTLGVKWYAFKSEYFDLEAPGYMGRMPMVYYPNIATEYFDATGKRLRSIYTQTPSFTYIDRLVSVPLAGYDGVLNDTMYYDANSSCKAQSLRTLDFSVVAAAETSSIAQAQYKAYLEDSATNDTIFGQMLLDLWAVSSDPDGSTQSCYNFSYNREFYSPAGSCFQTKWDPGNTGTPTDGRHGSNNHHWPKPPWNNYNADGIDGYPRSFRSRVCQQKNISVPIFFSTYLKPAYNSLFRPDSDVGLDPPTPCLCTHAEIAQIFALAVQTWMNTEIASLGSAAYGTSVNVTTTFNVETNRPSFVFDFPGCVMTSFKLFVPSPMSNWLGFRSVMPPAVDVGYNRVFNFLDRYSSFFSGPRDSYLTLNLRHDMIYSGQREPLGADWGFPAKNSAWMSPFDLTYHLSSLSTYHDEVQVNTYGENQNPFGYNKPWRTIYDGHITTCQFTFSGSVMTNQMYQTNNNGAKQFWQILGEVNQYFNNIFPVDRDLNVDGKTVGNTYLNHSIEPVSARGFTSFPVNINSNGYAFKVPIWDTSKNYGLGSWTTQFNGHSKAECEGWTPSGWAAPTYSDVAGTIATNNESPPFYSLVYENNDSPAVAPITFNGRSGFTENQILMGPIFNMCDITNVSWTTRLSARYTVTDGTKKYLAAHYWGLATKEGISLTSRISAYQASSELVKPVGTAQVTGLTQDSPTPAVFMTGSTVVPTQTNPFDVPLAGPASAYLENFAIPALEVPCAYGSSGCDSNVVNDPLYRPANYDSIDKQIGSTSTITVSPQIDTVALFGAAVDTKVNYTNATRPTYGILAPKQDSAPNGSIKNPFLLTLQPFATPQNLPGPGGVPIQWPAGYSPAETVPGVPKPTNTSTASGQVMFIVKSECFISIGSTDGDKAVPNNTSFSLWAINYDDFFTHNVQDWRTSMKNNDLDTSIIHKTYLRGTPYNMDESYDSTAYSTLGRSFFVGPTSNSSCLDRNALVTPLKPTPEKPVIIIIVPCFKSANAGPFALTGPDAARNTYSNNFVYNFTEAYSVRQIYSVTFTSPRDEITSGPLRAFYGLANDKSAKSADVEASNDVDSKRRKVYFDLSKSGTIASDEVPDTFSNTNLALDVRSVYTPTSSCVYVEPSASSDTYTSDTAFRFPFVTNGDFNLVSLDVPNWSNAVQKTQPFLPLAGTWSLPAFASTGDLESERYSIYTNEQLVPNYEGLAVVAEWRQPSVTRPSLSILTRPSFINVAVDRNPRPSAENGRNIKFPFTLFNYELQRPKTLFVMLCDVWRNALRAPVVPKDTTGTGVDSTIGIPKLAAKGLFIDWIDCMGPNDYDRKDANNEQWFSECKNTSSMVVTSDNKLQETPWFTTGPQDSRVWNPFLGGSFWNTFQKPVDDDRPEVEVSKFPPYIWWSTYRWQIGVKDPNNTWITSTATNPSLLASKRAVLTCSDGTIRLIDLTIGAQVYPIIDTTGVQTFLNNGINTSGTFSYVTPGRLFNLTWWASNWWCTADDFSIWTTAPTDSGLVFNDQVTVNNFTASAIYFRPMENLSPKWKNASWPQEEAHRYNVMKVIKYKNQDALFVGSIDGEFVIITAYGSSFQTELPNAKNDPWYFLPGPYVEDDNRSPVVYVSDIATIGNSLLVSSLPLPLNPEDEGSVPWYDSISANGPIALPITSLGLGLGTSILQIVNNKNTDSKNTGWMNQLVDSNVIRYLSQVQIDSTVSIDQNMQNAAALLTENSVISLQVLLRPSTTSLSNDVDLAFYDNATPFNDDNIVVKYGVQSEPSNSVAGSILFAPQVSNLYVDSGSLPTFFAGGIDMDDFAKAFFVMDSIEGENPPARIEQTSLRRYKYLQASDINTAPDGNVVLDGSFVGIVLRSNPYASPSWTNSVGYDLSLIANSNNYTASLHKPIDGPLSSLTDLEMNETDRAALGLFMLADVKRASPLIANLAIADMAYCKEANAFAWSTYGPYASKSISVGLLNEDGTIGEPLPYSPMYGDPQMSGPGIIAWNPYELKIYVAGRGTNVADWGTSENPEGILRPAGVPASKWAIATWDNINGPPRVSKVNRLMILTSDLSAGATSGIYAQPFSQLYLIGNQGDKMKGRVLSSSFLDVTCFGFSPHITAIGGSASTNKASIVGTPQSTAILYWRQGISSASDDLKANWSLVNLNTFGTVTAIKFVGYAWYIATWDPYANKDPTNGNYLGASTVFFASINFSAISPLDSWNTGSNTLHKITTIDSAILGSSVCGPGFEQDPDDPIACVKKCPAGYTAFGTLCVQSCPGPYTETGVPNECKPDSFAPRTTAPGGNSNTFTQGPKESPTQITKVENSINWTSFASISALILLLVLVILGFLVNR